MNPAPSSDFRVSVGNKGILCKVLQLTGLFAVGVAAGGAPDLAVALLLASSIPFTLAEAINWEPGGCSRLGGKPPFAAACDCSAFATPLTGSCLCQACKRMRLKSPQLPLVWASEKDVEACAVKELLSNAEDWTRQSCA